VLQRCLCYDTAANSETEFALILSLNDQVNFVSQTKNSQATLEISPARSQISSGPAQGVVDQLDGLFDQGRYADLEPELWRLLQDYPSFGYGWKMMTALLQLQGRLTEALPCATRSVQQLPNDAQCHSNLGVILRGLGQLQASEASHRRAIALYQGSAGLYASFAACLFDQRRFQEALACTETALQLDPKHINGLVNCANALGALGRLDEAVACYEKAMALNPDLGLIRNNLAAILCKRTCPPRLKCICDAR